MSRPGYLAVVNVVKAFESATPVSAMQDMMCRSIAAIAGRSLYLNRMEETGDSEEFERHKTLRAVNMQPETKLAAGMA